MSTELQSATSTLLDHYDQAASAGSRWSDPFGSVIDRSDLEALVASSDPSIPQDLRDAAQFLLDSDASRHFLDVGANRGMLDGRISRSDLEHAMTLIQTGEYTGALLDTAAGRSGWVLGPFGSARDGHIGAADLEAALLDPGVPEDVKDAIRLAQASGDPSAAATVLEQMDASEIATASALYRSPQFAALTPDQQALVSQALVDGNGDAAVLADLEVQLADPSFQALNQDGRTAMLTEFVLVRSPEFQALSSADQTLVRDALANRELGDTTLPASIASLLQNDRLGDLSPEEVTAVLSQVSNYPDSRSVENLDRLVGKDWFHDFSLSETQQAAKIVAYLSQYDQGDQTIIGNSLDKFLDDDAPYAFGFNEHRPGAAGSANADSGIFNFNPNQVTADNGPLAAGETYAAEVVLPHEVNHLVNGDKVSETYRYFNAEYRANYVDFMAEHGRPPTADEMLGVLHTLLTNPLYTSLANALANGGQDSDDIVALISDVLGRDDVTADNAVQLIEEAMNARDNGLDDLAPVPDDDRHTPGIQGNLDNS